MFEKFVKFFIAAIFVLVIVSIVYQRIAYKEEGDTCRANGGMMVIDDLGYPSCIKDPIVVPRYRSRR